MTEQKQFKALVVKKVGCAPCATLTRLLPTIIAKHGERVDFEVVEVGSLEEYQALGIDVPSFPSTILYDIDGNELGRQLGALGVDKFLSNFT